MANANVCRFCGREIDENPYLGDTNPDHVRDILNVNMPSAEILHPEGRQYDTFCSKEHYLAWVADEKRRLPDERPADLDTGPRTSL